VALLETLDRDLASATAAAVSTMAAAASSPITAAALEEVAAASGTSTGTRSGERRGAAAMFPSWKICIIISKQSTNIVSHNPQKQN